MDDENIYDDLPVFDLECDIDKLKTENDLLKSQINRLESEVSGLNNTVSELRKIQDNLSRNISELYRTAKAEIDRKNNKISELQTRLDDLLFKRQTHQIIKEDNRGPNHNKRVRERSDSPSVESRKSDIKRSKRDYDSHENDRRSNSDKGRSNCNNDRKRDDRSHSSNRSKHDDYRRSSDTFRERNERSERSSNYNRYRDRDHNKNQRESRESRPYSKKTTYNREPPMICDETALDLSLTPDNKETNLGSYNKIYKFSPNNKVIREVSQSEADKLVVIKKSRKIMSPIKKFTPKIPPKTSMKREITESAMASEQQELQNKHSKDGKDKDDKQSITSKSGDNKNQSVGKGVNQNSKESNKNIEMDAKTTKDNSEPDVVINNKNDNDNNQKEVTKEVPKVDGMNPAQSDNIKPNLPKTKSIKRNIEQVSKKLREAKILKTEDTIKDTDSQSEKMTLEQQKREIERKLQILEMDLNISSESIADKPVEEKIIEIPRIERTHQNLPHAKNAKEIDIQIGSTNSNNNDNENISTIKIMTGKSFLSTTKSTTIEKTGLPKRRQSLNEDTSNCLKTMLELERQKLQIMPAKTIESLQKPNDNHNIADMNYTPNKEVNQIGSDGQSYTPPLLQKNINLKKTRMRRHSLEQRDSNYLPPGAQIPWEKSQSSRVLRSATKKVVDELKIIDGAISMSEEVKESAASSLEMKSTIAEEVNTSVEVINTNPNTSVDVINTNPKSSPTEVKSLPIVLLTTEIMSVDTNNKESKTEVKTMSTEITESKTEVKSTPTEVKGSTEEVKSISTEVKLSQTKAKKSPTKVKKTTTEVKCIPTEVSVSTTQVKSISTEVKSSEMKVKLSPTKIKKSTAAVRSMIKEVKRSMVEIKSLSTKAKISTTEIKSSPTKVKGSPAKVKKSTAEVKSLSTEVIKESTAESKPILAEVKLSQTSVKKSTTESKSLPTKVIKESTSKPIPAEVKSSQKKGKKSTTEVKSIPMEVEVKTVPSKIKTYATEDKPLVSTSIEVKVPVIEIESLPIKIQNPSVKVTDSIVAEVKAEKRVTDIKKTSVTDDIIMSDDEAFPVLHISESETPDGNSKENQMDLSSNNNISGVEVIETNVAVTPSPFNSANLTLPETPLVNTVPNSCRRNNNNSSIRRRRRCVVVMMD